MQFVVCNVEKVELDLHIKYLCNSCAKRCNKRCTVCPGLKSFVSFLSFNFHDFYEVCRTTKSMLGLCLRNWSLAILSNTASLYSEEPFLFCNTIFTFKTHKIVQYYSIKCTVVQYKIAI